MGSGGLSRSYYHSSDSDCAWTASGSASRPSPQPKGAGLRASAAAVTGIVGGSHLTRMQLLAAHSRWATRKRELVVMVQAAVQVVRQQARQVCAAVSVCLCVCVSVCLCLFMCAIVLMVTPLQQCCRITERCNNMGS